MKTIKISEITACKLALGEDTEEFKIVDNKLTGCDVEDGGGDYETVVKKISDGKYYKFNYTGWDIDNTDYDYEAETVGERCDFNLELTEVKPKTVTVTEYE